ncbi:ATP-binding cassette subfamily B multidrug efflux pump [Faecalicoccus acidiformans]|uniref:ATP-binding cassette subfamily B multidrug efflux pump n=1 Tax=Faecalicoccus acidiformans TaxID=915173 RepID=A0A7W8D237_9FIRM|nr:ABC transporter ATP-binding protein [Faecalicoccus acidiformans]MBB5185354.1 ATP-binding cassette subfamily B multidrug efflux pump [Faecalicoccus acidiformans]MDM8204403.1 ABC transporter ATP-binding protein [Faecalicoccus acidiformans]
MRLILHYMKAYKILVFLNILSVFGFALAELGIPTLISNMIDEGVLRQDSAYLIHTGLIIALISVIGVLGTILLGYCCARISTSVTRDIRNDVFRKIQSFSHAQMNEFGVSSLITRTNNDAFQIMTFLNVILRTALLTPVMIFVSFTLTIRSNFNLSLIIASTVPVIVLGVFLVGKFSSPISERQQASLDRLNRIFRENLTGIRVIRSFNNDAYESERFDKENRYFMKQSRSLFKLMSSTEPIFFFVMNLAALAIYYVAAGMINANTLQVGMLIAFMEYLFHAMLSVMLFCTVFMMYPRAAVSARRIQAVFDSSSMILDPENPQDLTDIESLVFDDVTFVYPDGEEPVLEHISFEVKKGETIAFIGSTGSGKSTLIGLVPRFYDVSDGSIRINGKDIREYSLQDLRSKIGYVSQKAFLFRGSIADNIRFGKKDASQEEIEHASKVAQAYDFIQEKPDQFEERIVEGATNVSGGQKQRLSITRALVRHPQIYIYDDSFSALDFATDARLRKALKPEVKDAVMMIVAQRVSTIMDADHILVLNEGKVAGYGTHKELLENCSIYREIALSQLSEKELAYA